MRKIARIISVFAIEGVTFFLVVMGLVLGSALIRGIDPREGGFLFVSPLAMLTFFLAIVSGVYGIVSGIAVNIFWNYATRTSGNLFKTSVGVGATVASLWMLLRYLEYASSDRRGTFLSLENLYMFLVVLAVGATSTAIATAFAQRIFSSKT